MTSPFFQAAAAQDAAERLAQEHASLSEVADHPNTSDAERRAFTDMIAQERPLSERQREWLARVRDRLGLVGAANTFSGWSEARKAEEKKRAGRVLLPQEREGYVKPTKLQKRGS